MRYARIKPVEGYSGFFHVYNRCVGSSAERPLGPAEKQYFICHLQDLAKFYVIDIIAFQVMSNHFHCLVHVPAKTPSNEEAAQRYACHYRGMRTIDPQSEACTMLAARLRDLSCFMADLQQPFTRWYNRTRPRRRRGHLWAERFKSTALEDGLAVWSCWKYIEMNPVRARIADSPAQYRFCSFGAWAATGKHPFAEALERCVMPGLRGLLSISDLQQLYDELRKEFARIGAWEQGKRPEEVATAVALAAERERFSTRADRRVRYWTDGLVIGSELFVKQTIRRARGAAALEKRRLTRALASKPRESEPLYAFKQLRVLLQ